MQRQTWDEYFMGLAFHIASRSKDESTKVGAVAVGPDREIRSTGYNGFPRGVNDDDPTRRERSQRLMFTAHAEENVVSNAARIGVPMNGCIIYVSFCMVCHGCAKPIIQSGISEIIMVDEECPERWQESDLAAREMFYETGVKVRRIPYSREE